MTAYVTPANLIGKQPMEPSKPKIVEECPTSPGYHDALISEGREALAFLTNLQPRG